MSYNPATNRVEPDSDEDVSIEAVWENGSRVGDRFIDEDNRIVMLSGYAKSISKGGLTVNINRIANSGGKISTVTDNGGRTLTFTYNENGLIHTMTDPAGGVYSYTYDADRNLTGVTYPDGTTKTYLYNELAHTSGANLPHALTGIIDENGNRYATFTYDAQGRAISTEHAGGADKYRVTYNAGQSSTVTDPLNTVYTYQFQHLLGSARLKSVNQPCMSGCGTAASNLTFDANGNVTSLTDFKGVKTTYVYDLNRNLEISRTEAAGTPEARAITTQWHSTFRLPTKISEPGRSISFTYDSHGNRLTKTITAGGQSRTWTYTYNDDGQVTSVDGPRTDVADLTTLAYDAQGNLSTVTNALGHVTTYGAYDAHGRVGRITDPNGLVIDLAYDARGRLISRTVDGTTATFQYDGVGQLTQVTLPNGAYLQYTYSAARRLTDITDALGNTIHTTYDLAGNKLREEVFDPANTLARKHQWVYDSLSRLAQSIGAAGQTTHYGYDANGNLTSVTDPLNRVTTYAYDALNRLVSETDPLTGVTGYSYDALDRLLAVTDPASLTTSYTYNGFGDLLQEISPNTGTILYSYDSAGNRLTRQDANGITTTSSYDALNRLLSVDYPGTASDVSYTYDQGPHGLGRLTGLTDGAGDTAYQYDVRGRLTTQTVTIDGLSYTTRYGYDDADRLVSLTYPSGRVIGYPRDNTGRITEVRSTSQGQTEVVATGLSYRPFGPLAELTFGNGLILTRSFDADGRLTEQAAGTVQHHAYALDEADNILGITNRLDMGRNQNFTYDALDRLIGANGPYGSRGWSYDEVGNRLLETRSAGQTAYRYALDTHRLLAAEGLDNRSFAYDEAGRMVGAGSYQFGYREDGRLTTVNQESLPRAAYRYNGLGQRVQKTTFQTTGYHYDAAGHLIAESGEAGQPLREFVYLDDLPLAFIRSPEGREQDFNRDGVIDRSDVDILLQARNQPVGPGDPRDLDRDHWITVLDARRLVLRCDYPTCVGGAPPQSEPAVYFVQADHLAAPRLLTDQNQTVAWFWDSDPFGGGRPEEDPDGDQQPLTLNLRFPGQYYDGESGLHYNYFRDYDPSLGRYLESDPIGLVGGLNTYAYVGNNPIRYTDPRGLEAVMPFPATGAVGGAAAGALGTALGVLGGLIYPSPVGEGSDIVPPMKANFPPGYWPGDKGADEWGRRNGCGAKEGRRRFHDIKKDDNMSKATDKYGVNPSTGDVIDPEGEVIGNLDSE
ncbi:RHS repeat-associated core domain-containing protein [Methylocaldum sp. GT1TLB]|uniref:RHS repeat-associated core domain-containing protein n=1 Tax=Methylocaldum sp. GT1TLB TaxID=3438965 RepID=UPI003DA036E6